MSADETHLPSLAVAVVVVGGRYALQHRDDRPDIAWPGRWGLFGGSIEPGETPQAAMSRELDEELALVVPTPRLLWINEDERDALGRRRRFFVFEADVTETWHRHRLGEGQATAVFDVAELPALTVPSARSIIERHRAECPRG